MSSSSAGAAPSSPLPASLTLKTSATLRPSCGVPDSALARTHRAPIAGNTASVVRPTSARSPAVGTRVALKSEWQTRSVRIHAFGGPEALRVDTVALPALQMGELLVRVEAAGINPLDFKIRDGHSDLVDVAQLPFALGRDFAGVVEAVNGEGTGFAVGDAVFGMLGIDRGTYAERVIVKLGEVCVRPRCLDAAQAAAVPVAALTAWQGLFTQGRLQAGQTVLIHGAAGGVGHFAIQFARAHGAFVIATEQSTQGIAFAREMGADVVIDMRAEIFEIAVPAALAERARAGTVAQGESTTPTISTSTSASGVDVVFDLIGGETQHRSWDVLRDGGALISTISEPCEYEARLRTVRARHFVAHPSAAQLREIATLIDNGQVKVVVQETYGFMQAADALERLQAGAVLGKLVLTTDDKGRNARDPRSVGKAAERSAKTPRGIASRAATQTT
ncbi:NADP-dependent oxidoreductase [Robbsia sp. KACC 23696]|uniref:NADP-dependent oxidoreductase n=1 Tax=Robbsia sp. KACC 23696 TaxID=3149231 RepID=UPI00325B081B